MCDCFPQVGGGVPVPDRCKQTTGNSEYGENFKQWGNPVLSQNFIPQSPGSPDNVWKQRYSFSKGPRFGVPPYCDCTPPVERSNHLIITFSTIPDLASNRRTIVTLMIASSMIRRPEEIVWSMESDLNLALFFRSNSYVKTKRMPELLICPGSLGNVCGEVMQDPCGGPCVQPCSDEGCQNPCGIEIRYSNKKIRPPQPKLLKENLIKPGTDTSDCCGCPRPIPCCPCPEDDKVCDACCGCEYPCKLHQAATIPMRKYPISWNTPRYVPDPRVPPRRPRLLCAGGTLECPVQNQFPTQQAIKQAKYRLMDKLEKERCRYPPAWHHINFLRLLTFQNIAHETTRQVNEKARKAQAEYDDKGFPPKCMPYYCLEGGRPKDPRPPFDHFSTYEADYIWDYNTRFKLLGGEIPCQFEVKPLCCDVRNACEFIKERTEEKERWGEDWECCPPPPE
ncbi:hypothetical protein Ocin01_01125 [Orchesella cincta]|uniref:Uncharacterized protein n=1 Tax=Orchesella cincta TaxID=48709 RepID=A0A1D2NK03_ORCCI|nr:hypothetical protein Ocin01_01125 [Orchesella cincta]